MPTLYHDLVGHPDFTACDTSSVTKLGFAGAAMPASTRCSGHDLQAEARERNAGGEHPFQVSEAARRAMPSLQTIDRPTAARTAEPGHVAKFNKTKVLIRLRFFDANF